MDEPPAEKSVQGFANVLREAKMSIFYILKPFCIFFRPLLAGEMLT